MTKRQTRSMWIVGTLVAVTGCGVGLYLALSPGAPDPQTAEPLVVIDYLSSARFGGMSLERRQSYLDRMRQASSELPIPFLDIDPGTLSEEQRLSLMKNIMPAVAPRIRQRLDEFDQLSPQQQTARLDALIDHFQRSGQGPQNMNPQRIAVFLEYLDPYTRSSIRKHLPAMLGRMAQRGLTGQPSTAN